MNMMKKIYLGLLSVLFGMVLWLGFVKGDLIIPGISENHHPTKHYYPSQVNFSEKTYEFCSWLSNIQWYILWAAVLLFVYFILGFIPLCFIFKKMWEKWWKINIFILFKNVWIKQIFYWLNWICIFIVSIRIVLFIINPDWGQDIERYRFYLDRLLLILILICLAWLYFSLLMTVAYYRLFRKFGWNKRYAVLWTIFFPIWACVLWFGNFKCQWENLEKKEWNN